MRSHRLVRRSQDRRRISRRLWLELLEPRMCLSLDVPAFSSSPGAAKTIYMDFDGHVTQGTSWNSYFNQTTINSPAYNTDADAANFSATELTQIENAWKRTAEDYYPFQVNVTTVDPGVEALRNTGGGDTQWGIRTVITADNVGCGCGGIAYIDSFNWNSDTPVFVYNTGDKNVAEAASHEVGHSLGLSHDGTATIGYYSGHGSGETGWAPIMGVSYSKNVTQFDKGEYYGSNNAGTGANYSKGPDDLGIITSYNGFGYRTDDAGDTAATAASLTVSGTSVSAAGVIERTTDVDYFGFVTGTGSVTLNAAPFTPGPNLDVKLDLFDANGTLVASANPATVLTAGITATLAAGQYFLRVDGTGAGNPTVSPPTGYTEYASLGRYTITGTIVDAVNDALSIAATAAVKSEGNSGTTPFTFTVTRSGATTGTTTVDYAVTGSSAAPANATDFGGSFPGASLTFGPGITSQTITVNVTGDATNESSEGFTVTLSNASGTTQISNASATGTIQNDDAPPPAPTLSIAATSANKPEGTGTSPTGFTFTITRSGDTSGTTSVKYTVKGVGGGTTTAKASDFAGGVFPTNVTVNFVAGQTSAVATILVTADSVKEKNEKFRVTLSASTNATITSATADGIIQNDDGTATGASHSPSDNDHEYINVLLPHAFPLPGVGEEHGHEQVHTDDHVHDRELDMPEQRPVESARLIPLATSALFGGSPIGASFVLDTNRPAQVSPFRTSPTTSPTTLQRTRDAALSAVMQTTSSGDRATSRSSTLLRHGARTATRDASALQAALVDEWMSRGEPLDL